MCVIWTGGCHLLGGLMDLELAYGLDLLLEYPGLNYWLFFPCTCFMNCWTYVTIVVFDELFAICVFASFLRVFP